MNNHNSVTQRMRKGIDILDVQKTIFVGLAGCSFHFNEDFDHWLAFWNPTRVWIGISLKWGCYTWDLAVATENMLN